MFTEGELAQSIDQLLDSMRCGNDIFTLNGVQNENTITSSDPTDTLSVCTMPPPATWLQPETCPDLQEVVDQAHLSSSGTHLLSQVHFCVYNPEYACLQCLLGSASARTSQRTHQKL